ncbi:hypothetical protein AMTRI_Chr07g81480 [Amborella trichopoda]
MKPDLVIFVVESGIGHAAFDQARALTHTVPVAAVVVTKMHSYQYLKNPLKSVKGPFQKTGKPRG